MKTLRRRTFGGTTGKALVPLVLTLALVTPLLAASPEIVRVSFATTADGEGQIIRLHASGGDLTGGLEVYHETLNAAFVLVKGATLSDSLTRARAVDPVRSYRVSATDLGVRIDLQFDGYRPVRVIAYPDRDSNDALISVHYASVRGGVAAPVRPVSFEGSNGDERWTLDCVVLDAGHGGHDLGAVANGLEEKTVNLEVAKLIGKMVEQELGMRVIYTRTDDRFVSLEARGRVANEQCGKLFISIHANAARNRVAEGTEIYFLGLHKTEAARAVMERENAVIRLENDPSQYAQYGDDQFILQTLAQSVYLRESEALASMVDVQFSEGADRPGRGVKQAGFLVLWKASMPAILVELGFITNRREAGYLKSTEGQRTLAAAVFRAIRSYRDYYQKGITFPTAD